ncbi:hypothetical protein FXO38_26544 [Capsicum annuum]|nr:hypothetical protein FXO38_26544 [Capsicum annuum]
MCARHILANWSKVWKGIERRNYFWKYAKSIYEQELRRNLDHMELLGDKICVDLLWYNIERWSKVYFKYHSCCDNVDNNMARSFNAWILGPRHKTIITMLEEIRSWILKGIPCCHAIAALHYRRLEPINYVAYWYTKKTYLKTYSYYIQPITNMQIWSKSTNSSVLPPTIKILPSRPGKSRRKEQSKNKTEKLSKHGIEMSCIICHAKGCPLATSSTKSSVGSSAALGTKRGRERPKGSTKAAVAAAGRGRGVDAADAGKRRGVDSAAPGRGRGVDVVIAGRRRGAAAAGRGKEATATIDGVGRGRGPAIVVTVGSIGRGRGVIPSTIDGNGRGREVTASTIIGRGKGRGAAVSTVIGVGRGKGRGPGANKGRETNYVTGVGRGKGAPFKRPRMPRMPMNSSIVTGHLGHHKPKSGVKWKGKKVLNQQDLKVIRAQKKDEDKISPITDLRECEILIPLQVGDSFSLTAAMEGMIQSSVPQYSKPFHSLATMARSVPNPRIIAMHRRRHRIPQLTSHSFLPFISSSPTGSTVSFATPEVGVSNTETPEWAMQVLKASKILLFKQLVEYFTEYEENCKPMNPVPKDQL